MTQPKIPHHPLGKRSHFIKGVEGGGGGERGGGLAKIDGKCVNDKRNNTYMYILNTKKKKSGHDLFVLYYLYCTKDLSYLHTEYKKLNYGNMAGAERRVL